MAKFLAGQHVILLSAPASSGKTAFLGLFAAAYLTYFIPEISFLSDRGSSCEDRLHAIGIDIQVDKMVCQFPRHTIVLLDDVQESYTETHFWRKLLKHNIAKKIPQNVYFLLSATNSLNVGPNPSPEAFRLLPRFKRKHFKLSNVEADDVMNLAATAARVPTVFQHKTFRRVVLNECRGMIGGIRVAVAAISEVFFKERRWCL